MDEAFSTPVGEVSPTPRKQTITLQIDPEEFKRRFKEACAVDVILQKITRPPEAWDRERKDRIVKIQEEISEMFAERNRAKCQMQKLATRRNVLKSRLDSKRTTRAYLKRKRYKPFRKAEKQKAKRYRMIRRILLASMEVEALKRFRASTSLKVLETPKI